MVNEKRLIDIKITEEELKDIIYGLDMLIDRCCEPFEEEPVWRLIEKLKNAPTVEAVEVVHGKWKTIWNGTDSRGNVVKCSVCGYKKFDTTDHYCPNCGAKMDGDGNG